MANGGKVRRVGAMSALIVTVGAGAWLGYAATVEPEEHFCTVGLTFVEVDGHEVVLQDGGKPGRDGCEGSETLRGSRVLALDCKIRKANGDVVAVLQPNRDDGTCGLPEPGIGSIPSPWPKA